MSELSGLLAHGPDDRGVVRLQLNRPPGNRITIQLLEAFERTLSALHEDRGVRAVMLTATGQHFSQGADLGDARLAQAVVDHTKAVELGELGRRVYHLWANMPVPTVAGARGQVIGGGLGFFGLADIRVAAANTTLLLPELKRGIHITWGLLPALSHTLGEQLVRYLALSTRPVPVSYLPHWIVERAPNDHVEDRVSELATRLADRPSTAARAIVDTLRCMGRDEPDPAALDAVRFADSMQCPETREALMAWMTGKRG